MAHPALKRLERAGQAALFAVARTFFSRSSAAAPPDWDARPHRVLYLRYDRIGDMILATGLIRAVATSHAGITLDVLASPANAPVLDGNPYISRVLLFDRRRRRGLLEVLRQLRGGRYDVVIDGMVMTPSVTMMLLMLASGAPLRIGIGGKKNDFVYTMPVPAAPPESHIVEQSRQTAIPFGVDIERTDWRPELFMRASELEAANARWGERHGLRLLVNVSAVTRDRHWPADRYVSLVREAVRVQPSATVLLISAPNERRRAAEIGGAAGVALAETPTLRDAFGLIATADAVFTPDTSISHAAAALDVPLAVMIPSRSIFGPYTGRHVRIESPGSTLSELPLEHAVHGLNDVFALAQTGA